VGKGTFENNNSLKQIAYCGALTNSLPIKPTCPPARKAVIDAKAAADLKAKQEAELKAKQEAEAKVAGLKKKTITCVKGKLSKKATAVNPKCPSGYKKK
jgi:hypothetical protein